MLFQNNHLDFLTRLKIGLDVHSHKGLYGHVQSLARRYQVSRWFIYFCLHLVEGLQQPDTPCAAASSGLVARVSCVDDAILALYLEDEASVGQIQRSLQTLFGEQCSIGRISQVLNAYGAALPEEDQVNEVRLNLISDEIFGNGQPILVTISSQSGCILQLKKVSRRDMESWGVCWLEIVGADGQVERVVADMAKGIIGGVSLVFPEAVYQSDLLHVIMPLSFWLWLVERRACAAMQAEYDAQEKSVSAKRARTRAKYETVYQEQRVKVERLIYQADAYRYLFRELQEVLQIVDERTGRLRRKAEVEETIAVILSLIETLGDKDLTERVGRFRDHQTDLLRYFDDAAKADQVLQAAIPDIFVRQELIRLYAWQNRAWQTYGRRLKQLQANIACWTEILTALLSPAEFARQFGLVEKELSAIIRSSSLVENLNSRLRRYFNAARGQVNQNRLNLIRFYLNRVVFQRGRRKGASPRQLFYGEATTGHWLDELKAVANL